MAQNSSTNIARITTNEKYIINVINMGGAYIAPIGWSRNGYFAYVSCIHYSNGLGDYNGVGVTVINTITDEIVESYDKNSIEDDITSLDDFWLLEKQRITNMLEKIT
jgi:hypothetical protein